MDLTELNALAEERAVDIFLACCGSARWARAMTAGRPFASLEALTAEADRLFDGLGKSDWLEAFAAHPRIGERPAPSAEVGAVWSATEQSGVADASRGIFERRNRDYEARFGHTFIVCATGRTGAEMLQILERRMLNNADDELRQAAVEQRQITRLRLGRLLS